MEMDVNIHTSQMDVSTDVFEQDDAGSDVSSVDLFDDIDAEDSIPEPPSGWNRSPSPGPTNDVPMEVDQPHEEVPSVASNPSTSKDFRGPPLRLRRSAEEKKLADSLAKLREDAAKGIRNFGNYMQLKKDKLRYQVNVISRVTNVVSNIFEGVSIFVNGHTDPSALELRELIQTHGGEYHCYMEYGTTTYTVASSLASTKVDKTRKNEIFILPSWIIDSIASGSRLPIDNYMLMPPEQAKETPISNFFTKPAEKVQESRTLDARDPNFLQEFYARSRLHLISTLAQDMKDFMNSLREAGQVYEDEWQLVDLPSANGSRLSEPVIFHVDLDCFFVSVGLRNRPELEGKPVAITHSKGSASAPGFSEVASCSYAARRLGLKNGMLVRDALKLCPSLICLPYQFEDYRTVSKTIYSIISKFTLEVRAVSCDEMYINFSNVCNEKEIVDICGLANHIRKRIREETGCPASVGIGPNMLIARLATRKAKPNGVHWTRKQDVLEFIAKEKIENLPGVGYATWGKLRERFGELETCRDLQEIDQNELENILGKKVGGHIYRQCRGEDDSIKDFLSMTERKSVSCDINYGIRFTQREELLKFLKTVAEEVSRKLIICRRATGAVTLKLMIRSADAPVETAKYLGHGKCDSFNKTNLLKTATFCQDKLFSEIVRLFDGISPPIPDLRGIGVHCGRLVAVETGVRKAAVKRNFFEPKPSSSRVEPVRKKPAEEKQEEFLMEIMEPPRLRETSTPAAIRMELKAILLEEPSEENVLLLSSFLQQSMDFGAFASLRQYALLLARQATSKDCDSRWLTVIQALLQRLDTKLYLTRGAKMFERELRKNPYSKGLSLFCTCENSMLCTCK